MKPQSVIIAGAGLAGLLAANMFRRASALVMEAQPKLPNNHHAVLRFRTDKVSLQTGIPFRKVPVFKAIAASQNPIADALAYSQKVLGRVELRSVISTEMSERYIAPTDLIAQMADGLMISYNNPLDRKLLQDKERSPIISTIPMMTLMDLLGWEGARPDFKWVPGTVIKAKVAQCDVFATIYYPHTHNDYGAYRASITGGELTIEMVGAKMPGVVYQKLVSEIAQDFGLSWELISDIEVKEQQYAKIGKLDEDQKRIAQSFMFWATQNFNIYSLGRFATWRAGLLMDDVVNDVIKIEHWMRTGPYAIKKAL